MMWRLERRRGSGSSSSGGGDESRSDEGRGRTAGRGPSKREIGVVEEEAGRTEGEDCGSGARGAGVFRRRA